MEYAGEMVEITGVDAVRFGELQAPPRALVEDGVEGAVVDEVVVGEYLCDAGLGAARFDEKGLVPCVVQQEGTGEVLMVAWMNAGSLRLTLETGYTWFWSRSRRELWNKGATSGNLQRVRHLLVDCDGDTLLAVVDSPGPACHTGHRSCFYREIPLDSKAEA